MFTIQVFQYGKPAYDKRVAVCYNGWDGNYIEQVITLISNTGIQYESL